MQSIEVYDAPYPSGTQVTGADAGQPLYVRVTASDPFGAYDVTSIDLTIDDPNNLADVNVMLDSTDVVATTNATATFEYVWYTQDSLATYALEATAHEGFEGTIFDTMTGPPIIVSATDFGFPCRLDFVDTTGIFRESFDAAEQVCIRLVDFDRDRTAGVDTVSVSVVSDGGSVNSAQTLTETGPSTGEFTFCYPAATFIAGETITVTYIDPDHPEDTCVDHASINSSTPAVPSASVSNTLLSPTDGVALVGDSASYLITVTNTSDVTLNTVTLTSTFPSANLTYDSATVPPDTVGAGTLTWSNLGPLLPSSNVSITVHFTATAAAAPAVHSVSVTGTASAGPATANVTITDPQLTVTKTLKAGSSNPALTGEQVTFEIQIQNTGTTNVVSVPLSDNFSNCLEFDSATVAPDSSGGGVLVWNDLGALATGGVHTIETTFKVVGVCDPASNTAIVDLAVDANGDSVPRALDTATVVTQEAPKVAVGSTVWLDTGPNRSDNGMFDIGEGISGVAVEIYHSGRTPGVDSPLATTTTSGDGVYQFDDLNPGDYIIYLPNVSGIGQPLLGKETLTGSSIDDDVDNNDDGQDTLENGGVRSSVINLVSGTEVTGEATQGLYTGSLDDDAVNMTVDFGFKSVVKPIGIGGVVWIDGQGAGSTNGTFDHAHEGVDGITVELYQSDSIPAIDPALQVTKTANGGYYYFDSVPEGEYVVFIPSREFSSGALAGTTSINGAGGDDGVDNDDNGLDSPVNGGVASGTITLTVGGETTSEDQSNYAGSVTDDSLDATVDLGFDPTPGTVALGSRVWNDDGDGVFQFGEGAVGVTLQLYTDPDQDGDFSDGLLVATTSTSEDGFYLFDQLDDGHYIIHIPADEFASGPLAGATSLSGADAVNLDEVAADNENGVDVPMNGGISSLTINLFQNTAPVGELSQRDYTGTLDDNDVNMTIDFAFMGAIPDPALGNAVFIDRDGDGVMDAGEGINGVAVELYSAGSEPGGSEPLRRTTTRADGNYLFDLLPDGSYIVYLPERNFLYGAPLYGHESLPGAGGDDTNDDDVDENGIDQLVNGGIASAVIQIREGGEPVRENGSATGPTSVLPDESNNYTVDFGFHQRLPRGAIGNYVWVDEDSDGYQGAGESGLPGVTVELKNHLGSTISTTVTDSRGGYLFGDLRAGSYFVDIDETSLPHGMTQTQQQTLAGADFGNQDHSGNGYAVTIGGNGASENLTADFGYNYNLDTDVNLGTNSAALGHRVWIDGNADGLSQSGEIGVKGITLSFIAEGADGLFGTADDKIETTAKTNSTGHYIFDEITPGAYQVKVTDSGSASHDVTETSKYKSVDGLNSETVIVGPGDVFLNVNFGFTPTTANLGSIGSAVWLDIDADGVRDSIEPGIEGVTVTLVGDLNGDGSLDSGDDVLITTTTNDKGDYLFENLPLDGGDGDAHYLIWVNDTNHVLEALTQTSDSDGALSSPDISATNLDSGSQDVRNQNFGYTPGQPPGSIGDFVWLDSDENGVQNEVSAGIQDVGLELLDHSGKVVATAVTDVDGYYLFSGLPVEDNVGAVGADYTVRVATDSLGAGGALELYGNTSDPDNGTSSPDHSGGTVTLTLSEPYDRQQDFGYSSQALGSIGDTVWFDADGSGGDRATQGERARHPMRACQALLRRWRSSVRAEYWRRNGRSAIH